MKLKKNTKIRISTGHLLVIWDVIANKLSGSSFMDTLSEEERRGLWALQDLSEAQIAKLGIEPRPENEWELIMVAARKHVRTIPVEFLE
jgi:hypothetical protein